MNSIFRRYALLLCLLMGVLPCVHAFDSFLVKDIKLVGLQRISAGTVFNYLPLKVGDILDEQRSADAVRALFKTGFFQDVQLGRDGDLLVVTVVERPSIDSVSISGNREIDTETLKKALKDVGLAETRVFDRSLLDKVEQELQRQYFSLGKYGVKINSKVVLKDRNRADVSLEISEGDAARIQRINIVGSRAFSEQQLVDTFELSEPGFSSFFSSSDKYSKPKLRGDLETLRSFYLDRGYINFNIESTQVTIAPDKKDIYVTINVDEGDKFSVSDVKLMGEMVVAREELEKLVTLKKGDTFSRSTVTAVSNAISERLGDDGYAFANVNAAPEIDNAAKTVAMTFFVDPGKRVYVRRINISGNTKTEDEVIRRELRQMEGGWFTPKKLNRSRVRLQRLSYFDQVNIETPAVPGTADQVDVNINVTEGSTGQLQAGLGYGQPSGLIFNASVTFNNFVGTGKRVALEATNDRIRTVYSFSYTNPYYTPEGISRTLSAFYRQTDTTDANVADYSTDDKGGRISYGFPLSEYNTARLGLEVKNTSLSINTLDAPPGYKRWVCDFHEGLTQNGCAPGTNEKDADFTSAILDASWSHDTRDRTFFADAGSLHQIAAELALPGADVQYYKLKYNQETSVPFGRGFTLQMQTALGYGAAYGDTRELPFFENFYAGGNQSVRGFRPNSLGPKETYTYTNASNVLVEKTVTIGGPLKVVGNLELIFPLPFAENSKSFRLSTFVDVGNVFAGPADFDWADLRASYGFSALWVTPVGVLTFSYGWPLQRKDDDERQVFQFFIGAPF